MCCCLPMAFLKGWAVLAGLVNIGLGAFWIYFKGVLGTLTDGLVPKDQTDVKDIIDLVVMVFLIFGIVEIVIGAVMILQAFVRIKILIFFSLIFIFIFFIVAAVFGAIGMMLPTILEDEIAAGNQDGCFSYEAIAQADMAVQTLSMIWCQDTPAEMDFSKIPDSVMSELEKMGVKLPALEGQTIPAGVDTSSVNTISLAQATDYMCQCGLEESNLDKWSEDEHITRLKEGSVSGGPTIITDCSSFEKIIGEQGGNADFEQLQSILEAIEDFFECTGLCTGDYLHYFMDVNEGPPKDTENGCYVKMREWLDDLLGTLFIIGILGAVINLLSLFFMCSLCCKAKKEKEGGEGAKVQGIDN